MNKEYKCAMCGSVAKDAPGTCCGAERKEAASNKCEGCGNECKADGSCDCGCK